jgi:hypothetical protein
MSLPAGDLASRAESALAIFALSLLTRTLTRCRWALASAERAATWAGESLRTSQLSRFRWPIISSISGMVISIRFMMVEPEGFRPPAFLLWLQVRAARYGRGVVGPEVIR